MASSGPGGCKNEYLITLAEKWDTGEMDMFQDFSLKYLCVFLLIQNEIFDSSCLNFVASSIEFVVLKFTPDSSTSSVSEASISSKKSSKKSSSCLLRRRFRPKKSNSEGALMTGLL